MIILIPMPIFLQSQLPLKRKIVLCGVFALGAFTVCCPTVSWDQRLLGRTSQGVNCRRRKYCSWVLTCLSFRSFPPSSTRSTASTSPSAPTGRSGTSESPQPPSSPPTFPTSGPFSAASSTSGPSAAHPTASLRQIPRRTSAPTLPTIAPSSDPKSGLKAALCTASTVRSRSTRRTRCRSRSTPSTKSRSEARMRLPRTEILLRAFRTGCTVMARTRHGVHHATA